MKLNSLIKSVPHRLFWGLLAACVSSGAGAATNLADAPIGATVIVPANVILDLSVEFPTAVTDAYLGKAYSTSTEFAGYFNPNFCYDYTANTAYTGTTVQFGVLNGYFAPVGAATAHACSGHWSGNFLNWVMTQTIDPLRQALTGGTRIVDTAATTILQKAYQDNQGGGSNQNVKSITTAAVVHGATPFTNWSNIYVNNANTGLNFIFSPNSLVTSTTTGTDFAGVTVAQANGGTCSTGGSGSGGSTAPGNNTFVLADSPNTLTVTQGCGNTSVITITFGSSLSDTVTFAVTGLPGGVSASGLTSVAGTKGHTYTKTLTLTASNTATIGTSTVTIKGTGTASGKTSTVTIALTVASNAPSGVYSAQSSVQVCSGVDAPSDLDTATPPGRCRAYGSNYKPVGLMQKYAAENTAEKDSIRYSVFGYLLDYAGTTNNEKLDGGVMRARMASVGPYEADPGSPVTANANPEWDAATGVFSTNPDPTDAANTPAVTGATPTNSGVINYLNKFGFAGSGSASVVSAYKRYDSVSELYYAATRYYRNLGNLASHTNTAPAITSGEATNDGFPVITAWGDPIKYSCAPNYIVGIGDEHTWNDANVPGSTLNGGYEVADAQVTSDTGVNATTATNYIGNLEKIAGYTGAGVVPGASPNNGSDYIQAANLGNIFVNASTSGNCCNGNTFYMAGLAYDAHTRDIRPDITPKKAPITVSTFWLDVMEGNDYHEKNQFWMTAKYGGFDTSNATAFPGGYSEYSQAAPLPVQTWNTGAYVDDHSNYAPDQYYQAANPTAMKTGLNSAFAKIAANIPTGTSTALVLGGGSISATGNANYTVSFANDWSGNVVGSTLVVTETGGSITTTPTVVWNANRWLPNTDPSTPVPANAVPLTATSRIIATSSSVAGSAGVPFELGNLSTAEAATLGPDSTTQGKVLAYVRGDQTNETAIAPATTALFRKRTYTLGDITNSKPIIVAAPTFPYSDAPLNPGYSAFESANSTRGPVLYVGANDGMMHAFDASVTSTTGGKELFAYVPSFLLNSNVDANGNPVGLASITVSPLQHHFMVDASPTVIDVDFDRTRASGSAPASTAPSDWHTILVSGLGKGGKGFFSLDVTNPTAITTEAAMASNVLWENSLPHMGYSYGTPLVVKTARYGWTVVLTSGYDNDDGHGYIYLVSPKDGSLYETIPMPDAGTTTTPAGLAFVSGYINNYADYTADSLYAGDLLGNVWRIDLTNPTSSATVQQFATLADSSGNAQPVTTEPVIATDPSTLARYVFVGTGRLLADTDLVSSAQQTFYAFTDGDNAAFDASATTLTRSDLTNNSSSVVGGVGIGATRGFYIDLAQYPAGAGTQASAERINAQPVASGGVVAFAANLVGQDACGDTSSRLFALGYNSGTSGTGNIGNSLLVDSSGNATAAVSQSSAVTNVSLVADSVTGKLDVLAGLATGGVFGGLLSNPAQVLQKLNWREVPSAN